MCQTWIALLKDCLSSASNSPELLNGMSIFGDILQWISNDSLFSPQCVR